ncbi:MAG: hypothetical protein OQJ84_12360 [Xanthomonadales bacterium]|nr:hypothetical protein [Xanthomonadales bacterium]
MNCKGFQRIDPEWVYRLSLSLLTLVVQGCAVMQNETAHVVVIGFAGNRHGGESMGELLIPLLMAGPHVRPGKQIAEPVNIYDIAATAALLLDVELSRGAIGRPVCSALEHPECR